MADKRCIAVVSPFLDKRHGTERCIAEQVERLAHEHGYDVHLYAQRVEDIEAVEVFGSNDDSPGASNEGAIPRASSAQRGRILWHRISDLPGPHLVKYVWWLLANQFRRWRDQRRSGRRYDIIYSAGINCWDADAITVHIVFHDFYHVIRPELRLRNTPPPSWLRVMHRLLYYQLLMALERRLYSDPRVMLAAVSGVTAEELRRVFRREDVQLIHNAVDTRAFNRNARQGRRKGVRSERGYRETDFVLLFMGNDWKTKGLRSLLEAAGYCRELPLQVLVVGRDARAPYEADLQRLGLQPRVQFALLSAEVMQFYAAADAYVAPSLYDSFALPAVEAMACGLPVIISQRAGVSELIEDGVDGFVLQDPRDTRELARQIRLLYDDPALRERLSENAARTAQCLSWERNVEETKAFLDCARNRKMKVVWAGR